MAVPGMKGERECISNWWEMCLQIRERGNAHCDKAEAEDREVSTRTQMDGHNEAAES